MERQNPKRPFQFPLRRLWMIVVCMVLAYLAFAGSIEFAKRHPITDPDERVLINTP